MTRIALCVLILFLANSHEADAQHELNANWIQKVSPLQNVHPDHMDVEIDEDGSVYSCFNASSEFSHPDINGGVEVPDKHAYQPVILKTDDQGRILWSHVVECYSGIVSDLALTPNGDLIACGTVSEIDGRESGAINRRPHLKTSNGKHLASYQFLTKYSAEGEIIWTRLFGQFGGVNSNLVVTSKGEIIWSIFYHGQLTYKGHAIDHVFDVQFDNKKIAILKLDQKGEFVQFLKYWVTANANEDVGMPIFVFPIEIEIDPQDNIIFYGNFHGVLQLAHDIVLKSEDHGAYQLTFVAKMTTEGEVLWCNTLGGQGVRYIRGLEVDERGEVHLTGEFSHECVISGSSLSASHSDVIQKSGESFLYCTFKSDGNLGFAKYHRQPNDFAFCVGTALALDSDGRCHVFGYFSDSLQFSSGTPLLDPGIHTYAFSTRPNGDSLYCTKKQTGFFHSVWEHGTLVHLQRIFEYDKIGDPRWLICRKATARDDQLVLTGSYWGKPELGFSGEEIELHNGRDSGTNYYYLSLTISPQEALLVQDQEVDVITIEEENFPTPNEFVQGDNRPELVLNDDFQNLPWLEIYPNPTPHDLNVRFKASKSNVLVEVFSTTGGLLMSAFVNDVGSGNVHTLNVSNLSAGVYYVIASTKSEKECHPFIKVQ